MFHSQQSSSSNLNPNFPSQSLIANANPSPSFPFPPLFFPSGVASEPPLHPPGTDPHGNSGLLQSNHVGLEGQPQYYADPNAGSHNWVMTQAEPVRFPPNFVHENQIPSTSSWDGHHPILSFAPDAGRIKQEQTKAIQPLRCKVCKIECNSKNVFDTHVLGKKHKKNLEVQNSSLTIATSADSTINVLNQMDNVSDQVVLGTSEDLEAKKRKLLDGGTTARVCTVCNIACNSQEVFNKHLSGKRHAAQAALISHNPFVAAIQPRHDSSLKKKQKKKKVVQSASCEVCKINCNSTEIYAKHLAGKKHAKNMEKLEKVKNDINASNALPASTDLVIGPMENPAADNTKPSDVQKKTQKSSAHAPENLETKKRKLVEFGVAAGAVRTCTVCNVVCNSQTVYDSHLAGQKHAAMVKKQAESGSSIPDPSSAATVLPA